MLDSLLADIGLLGLSVLTADAPRRDFAEANARSGTAASVAALLRKNRQNVAEQQFGAAKSTCRTP